MTKMMLEYWPSKEKLNHMKKMGHSRFVAEAEECHAPAVTTLEVPTRTGRFGVSATAFGVAMVFFPTPNADDIQKRMAKHHMTPGSCGKKRAIEAGLELMDYMCGKKRHFETPLDLSFLTPFQQDILNTLRSIPFGETITYGELANLAGHPKKARAVGRVMGNNPAPVFVPCHRVLPASGGLGGWSGAAGWKKRLLMHEGLEFE